ncbi:endonuclease YncB(thermonuclease family) [Hoeflea marina]|uniref:Endonuclease YncB(Thermonuclease family) n=1 Tax=Hoeflea marina TaxID=274592 RepID=A0A317PH28_9HYPH|nr:thermonuclease family protein [Hoeflea marina]PWV99928.1 endonuclease YncB(thermonuclease family) [Hoeflea marina]
MRGRKNRRLWSTPKSRRGFAVPLLTAFLMAAAFAAPFVADAAGLFNSRAATAVDPSDTLEPTIAGLIHGPLPICGSGQRITCIVDGDTGWLNGEKWRLAGTDTPEISSPECQSELTIGIQARDRLRVLMTAGYLFERNGTDRYGRTLVEIRLADGRDVGDVLESEGLSQAWPNTGNRWCGR